MLAELDGLNLREPSDTNEGKQPPKEILPELGKAASSKSSSVLASAGCAVADWLGSAETVLCRSMMRSTCSAARSIPTTWTTAGIIRIIISPRGILMFCFGGQIIWQKVQDNHLPWPDSKHSRVPQAFDVTAKDVEAESYRHVDRIFNKEGIDSNPPVMDKPPLHPSQQGPRVYKADARLLPRPTWRYRGTVEPFSRNDNTPALIPKKLIIRKAGQTWLNGKTKEVSTQESCNVLSE